tara:strand:+ start:5900 stop:7306 length:1407 start_codon:yes stop_codon:yes gene_type:complete
MALFKFYLQGSTEEQKPYTLTYDNTTSQMWQEDGDIVIPQDKFNDWSLSDSWGMDTGKGNLQKIKINLGLKCNYSCEYCSQRFVPRNKDDHLDTSDFYSISDAEIESYVGKFDNISVDKAVHFELWGGEPFLYWKTMKPLIESLHTRYPESTYSVITNGSMFTDEIIDFIMTHNIQISISHDGPGQPTRGPDPFDDPESARMIQKLKNKLAGNGKISFNSMVHKGNPSRAKIQRWFKNKVGTTPIGEGGTVDAYDEGGKNMSWSTNEEHIEYRSNAFADIIKGGTQNFLIRQQKIEGFVNSLRTQRPAEALNQKCGMDDPSTIAVDMNGNVTTCQNVTASSSNTAGVSHNIGTINEGDEGLSKIKINAGTHWSDRKECGDCPVLQLCQGSCLFLAPDSDYWEISCNNAYSDNVVWLAASLYDITKGMVLYRIEGPDGFREERRNIFGLDLEEPILEEPVLETEDADNI